MALAVTLALKRLTDQQTLPSGAASLQTARQPLETFHPVQPWRSDSNQDTYTDTCGGHLQVCFHSTGDTWAHVTRRKRNKQREEELTDVGMLQ